MVAFDHQQLGIHPRLGEMTIGGGVAGVGRKVGGQVVAVVVVGPVAGQRQQPDQGHGDGRDQDRPRPSDDDRAELAPSPNTLGSLGFERLAELRCHRNYRGAKG